MTTSPLMIDPYTMIPVSELRFQDIPIYDVNVAVFTNKKLMNPIQPQELPTVNGDFKYMYFVKIDHVGYGTLSYGKEDVGEKIMIRIRAKDFKPYQGNHTLMDRTMIMYNPLVEDLSYGLDDPEVAELEKRPDKKGVWMGELIESIITGL